MMPLKRCPVLLSLILLLFGAWTSAYAANLPQDKQSAIILAYHRIGEDSYPDTNIRFEQFQDHLEELTNNDYNVISLENLFDAINNEQPLPPKTVVITFEGAYKSAFTHAVPLLNHYKLPYTVFYSADLASANTGQYMNWEDLKNIKNSANGSLGILPSSYVRLNQESEEETRRLINSAIAQYSEKFAGKPNAFSIPFGEWSKELITILKDYNFQSVWGLQSGVFYPQKEDIILPRFSITENYANLERLSLILGALPLPLHDITQQVDQAITIGFTIDPELTAQKNNIHCYSSSDQKLIREDIGDDRIEIKIDNQNGESKIRVNCTLAEDATHWRWAGFLLSPTINDPNNIPEPDELLEPQEQNGEAYSQSQP